MFRNVKIVVWALFLALLAAVPNEVSASCTKTYALCINGSAEFSGSVMEQMSDIECSAEWIGCVVSKLKFW